MTWDGGWSGRDWGGGGGRGGGGRGGPGRDGHGGRGSLAASDEDLGKAFDWRIMRRLFAYMVPFKRRASFGVAAMLLLQATHIAQPLLEGWAIDRIVAGDQGGLFRVGGIYGVTIFLSWTAQYQQVYQMTWVGQHVLYQVASDMFNHIVRLSPSFFDGNETGRIMSRVQSDVNLLRQLLGSGIVVALGNLLLLFGIIATMFVVNWRLAAITATVMPLFAITLFVWQKFARRRFRRARATISEVNASLQENVSGVRVIQSLGREQRNSQEFSETSTANLEANLGASRLSAATQPIVEITSALALALVVFFGGSMVIDGDLSIGLLFAFTRYVNRLFDPLRQLTQEYNQLQRATVAAERIFELLDTEREIKDAPDAIELSAVAGQVTYDHVSFGYGPEVEVLHDFSLDVQPGERVAFVGQTGAGKSTLVSLLLRFYEVSGGAVRVDGHDIRDVTLESLRHQTGVVLQEPVLFAGTVADNLRFGRPQATDAEVQRAAEAVGADEIIGRMAHGLETPVHERGVGLSIGERQLIAFARALIAQPRILILDEATANLDTRTESIVQRGIRELTQGRTALIIAHRLSTIRDADRIVVLEQGRIVEEGNHEALIEKRGVYYRLYSLAFQQAGAGEASAAATALGGETPAAGGPAAG